MSELRNTKQRQLVLDAVRALNGHPSAAEIYQYVRELDDRISRGTVYRNLSILVLQGEIRKVTLKDFDRFEGKLEKHYHFLCKECGEVNDVPMLYQDALDKEAAKETGYKVETHRTVFEGLCPNCQLKQI
ncbi:MAG TPA: transcriptional repressor [Clostridia bacterium]|nr:transcriptional repressor [Clostridia bacterium]HOR12462.1 transcriptional repressor [Clostridia bacterium]